MDRLTVYRDQLPLETHILLSELYAFEGLGLFARDLIGDGPAVGGFDCTPTSPASMDVLVKPGRIYQLDTLVPEDWGKLLGQGGVDADTASDHAVLKQGLLRDTATFTLAAPGTAGKSIVYLLQGQFSEEDAAATSQQFWNSTNPAAPISNPVSPSRLNTATVSVKAGVAADTGTETAPAVDAGHVPLWLVTVDYGQTSILIGDIVAHPSVPTISVGGGGGGGGSGLLPWEVVTSDATLVAGHRYIVNPTGPGLDLTLPAGPAPSAEIWFKGKFVANNVTIHRNGQTIEDVADDLTLNEDFMSFQMVFDGATWRL